MRAKRVIIQINKGFKDCRKRLCSDSKNDIDITHKDISHAYLNAFKHALENQYQNIFTIKASFQYGKKTSDKHDILN